MKKSYIVVFAVVVVGGLVFANWVGFSETSIKVASIPCQSFDIEIDLGTQANWLEGDSASYSITYHPRSGNDYTIYSQSLGPLADSDSLKPLPVNTDIKTVILSEDEGVTVFLPRKRSEGSNQEFSESEFDNIVQCMSDNLSKINSTLSSIDSNLPKGIAKRSGYYFKNARKINSVAHIDTFELYDLIQRAGVYSDEEFNGIRIALSGDIQKDYKSTGIDIFSFNPSNPIEVGFEWVQSAQNKNGMFLIERIKRVQQKMGIKFN
jgi:hypothetical protein